MIMPDIMVVRFMRVLLVIWILYLGSDAKSIQEVKKEAEDHVKQMALRMRNLYEDRCSSSTLSCDNYQIYNGCEGTGDRTCFQDFNKDSQCFNDGRYLSQHPTITYIDNQQNTQLSQTDIQFICTSVGIGRYLKQTWEYPYKWMYIALNTGSMIFYPGYKFQGCDQFDPRFRPWYVAATTGRKNVILLIDNSNERLQEIKSAARSVINTLGPGDNIAVISFNTDVRTLGFNGIVRATDHNKADLVQQIIDLSAANGSKSYLPAFQKSIQLLEQDQNNAQIQCLQSMNIFLLITNQKQEQTSTQSNLLTYMDEKSQKFPINLFVYGIEGDQNNQTHRDFLKQLTCRYDGIFFTIEQGLTTSQITNVVKEYHIFLSNGITVQNPMWTEPYRDYGLHEDVISVSYPIYFQQEGSSINILIGVASTDISMEYLEEFGVSKDNVVEKFIDSNPCQTNSLGICELQKLRQSQSDYAVCAIDFTCPEIAIHEPLCANRTYPQSSQIFEQPKDTSDQKCCGLTKKQFILAVTLGTIGLALVVTMVIILSVKHRNKMKKQKASENNIPQSTNIMMTQQKVVISPRQNGMQNTFQQ